MYVYLLKNGRNGKIISACDDEVNASTLKANLLKVGQYDTIQIEKVQVDQSYIEPLSIVKINGDIKPQGPVFSIAVYNPQGVVSDTLTFNVSGNVISFNGFINLTQGERQLSDVEGLKQRIANWVSSELSQRLMNDNPI